MTIEVALLNKNGISIAADKNVFIYQNGKIVSHPFGQKIYPLTMTNEACAMIYGNPYFRNIPWDAVLKKAQNITSDHLNYTQDILKAILGNLNKINKDQISSEPEEINSKEDLNFFVLYYLQFITNFSITEEKKQLNVEKIKTSLPSSESSGDSNKQQNHHIPIFSLFTKNAQIAALGFESAEDVFDHMYSIFGEKTAKIFTCINECIRDNLTQICHDLNNFEIQTDEITNLSTYFCQAIFGNIIKDQNDIEDEAFPFTGLTIAGYGNDEMLPSISWTKVGPTFNGTTTFKKIKTLNVVVDAEGEYTVFGKKEMIETIIYGVSDSFRKHFRSYVYKKFSKDSREKYQTYKLYQTANAIQEKNKDQFKSSISHLPIEKVTQLAKSLVLSCSIHDIIHEDSTSSFEKISQVQISKANGLEWIS